MHNLIDKGTDSPNLFLIMSGSFWFAILICSVIGLFKPNYVEPILLIQLIYKSLYSIYYAIGFNSFKFAPYGYVFCFFLPWIIILVIFFSIRLFKKYRLLRPFVNAISGQANSDQIVAVTNSTT